MLKCKPNGGCNIGKPRHDKNWNWMPEIWKKKVSIENGTHQGSKAVMLNSIHSSLHGMPKIMVICIHVSWRCICKSCILMYLYLYKSYLCKPYIYIIS